MLNVVLATVRPQALQAFAETLSANQEAQVKQVGSVAEALETIRTSAPHLVIIDSDLPDAAPLDLVRKLLMINATVNTAVISPLSDTEFHEAGEGLGIICRLPEEPGRNEAIDLLLRLKMMLEGTG
jgi:DNA-binding NarL/FixJ family response regulator